MDKHGIITGFSVMVLVACFVQSNAQTVGTVCTDVGGECTAENSETCVGEGEIKYCECAADHINIGNGTCEESACSDSDANCGDIPNTHCVGSICVCDIMSHTDTSTTAARGSCVKKAINDPCTSDENCADVGVCDVTAAEKTCKIGIGKTCEAGECVTNADCVEDKCACMSGYSGTDGGNACTANSAGFTIKMNVVGMILAMVTSVIYVM